MAAPPAFMNTCEVGVALGAGWARYPAKNSPQCLHFCAFAKTASPQYGQSRVVLIASLVISFPQALRSKYLLCG